VIGPNRSANLPINAALTIAPTAMLPRIRPTSTPTSTELANDEHDEQHDEEALGDLSEAIDEDHRSQRPVSADCSNARPHSRLHSLAGLGVGGDRRGVGSHEHHRDRDRNEREAVDHDHCTDSAEANRKSSER
jgi:hypothetical protein